MFFDSSIKERGLNMEQKAFYQRVLIPIGIVMLLMILSINIYNISPKIGLGHPDLGRVVSNISAFFMFISIWLGGLIALPYAFRAGATMKERFLVCLATPVVWVAKTIYMAGCIYSGWELVYWSFNTLTIGVIGSALLNMGTSETICRLVYKSKGLVPEKVFQPSVVTIFLIGLIIVLLGLWNGGTLFFYIYVDIYTMLFH